MSEYRKAVRDEKHAHGHFKRWFKKISNAEFSIIKLAHNSCREGPCCAKGMGCTSSVHIVRWVCPPHRFSSHNQDAFIKLPFAIIIIILLLILTTACLGVLLTSAAMLGVDACPMEGIIASAYDEILESQKDGYEVLCVCALGYRSVDDKIRTKVRNDKNDIFKWIWIYIDLYI